MAILDDVDYFILNIFILFSVKRKGQAQDHDGVVIPKLAGMAQKVGDAIGHRDRIMPLFRRMNELERLLEPASATETGLTLEARAELILSEESKLKQNNALLEQVKDKKNVLDSETLKNVPNMEGQLLQLTKVHLQQSQDCDQWSDEVLELIDQYNDVIESLTKTFIEYDKVLSAAEDKK